MESTEAFLALRQTAIPEHIEADIVRPHEHEGAGNPPLWLVWKVEKAGRDNVPYFPALDSVCDSIESARYHVAAVIEGSPRATISVERIPANHRFASSLDGLQWKTHVALWKERLKRVDGD